MWGWIAVAMTWVVLAELATGGGVLLGRGECTRKCDEEARGQWDFQCEHLRNRMKRVDGHDTIATKSALHLCEHSKGQHIEGCNWRCRNEL
mmetsp:Transcript_38080/g.106036  ORF Transcript_38080/g.106036 Transcript_38080/m.106036 type:complete len:91 (+) Transcript_38080:52-324(+)